MGLFCLPPPTRQKQTNKHKETTYTHTQTVQSIKAQTKTRSCFLSDLVDLRLQAVCCLLGSPCRQGISCLPAAALRFQAQAHF